jgi:DNA repair ATPase RecN
VHSKPPPETHKEGQNRRYLPNYRTVLEALISDWQGFRKALRKEDREAFDRLMDKARGLSSAAGYDPRTDPMESVFMSTLVELEQELEELRKKIEELEKRDTH